MRTDSISHRAHAWSGIIRRHRLSLCRCLRLKLRGVPHSGWRKASIGSGDLPRCRGTGSDRHARLESHAERGTKLEPYRALRNLHNIFITTHRERSVLIPLFVFTISNTDPKMSGHDYRDAEGGSDQAFNTARYPTMLRSLTASQ